MGYVKMQIWKA